MIKKIWDRRRRQQRKHDDGNHVDLHLRKPKRVRKKGVRRKRAATLLLGLSTMMPMPGGKLIHPTGSKSFKSKISVASSSTQKKTEQGSSPNFSGMNWNNEHQLWLPQSLNQQKTENKEPLQMKPVDEMQTAALMPGLPYADIVYPLSTKYDVDWRLVAAIIEAESGFDADAVSPVGARGLMQLMPETAADYGVTSKCILDPASNIEAGVKHLKKLSDLYDGDIPLIAAAYNAGQGTVAKFYGIPPFEETRTYVERVVSYYNSFAA